MRYIIYGVLLGLLFFILYYLPQSAATTLPSAMPKLMLWTWEYPNNLSSIDPKKMGVADLMLSIQLKDKVHFYTKHQALFIPPHTYKLAVVNIQAWPVYKSHFNKALAEEIAHLIAQLYQARDYNGLQIDFDAPVSLRPFYYELLTALRKELGTELNLSITALTSWCLNEHWLSQAHLPINFAVPMLYDLDPHLIRRLSMQQHFPTSTAQFDPLCRSALGFATYPNWRPKLNTHVPVFVFTQGPWRPETVEKAREIAKTY